MDKTPPHPYALFQNIIEKIPVRIFWKDRESRYQGCNTLFARDAGLAGPAELVGKTDAELAWKEQAALYVADDRAVIDSGVPKLGYEEPKTAPDGSRTWLRTSKVPLCGADGNTIGVLGIYEDITAEILAKEREARLTRALKLLSRCNMLLVRAEREGDLLMSICQLAVEVGGYRMAWVGLAENDAAKTVRPAAQAGFEEGYLAAARITWADDQWGRGPTGTAIRSRSTVANQDFLSNPKTAPWRESAIRHGYQSSIALPLLARKGVLGALTLYAAEPHAFGSEEVALLEELAGDLAFGMEMLHVRAEHEASEKKLEFLSYHDALTGLPNRVLLHDRFDQAAIVSAKEGAQIALLMLDIDNFKQMNDSLGHALGDRLMVGAVGRLLGCVRKTDTVSRMGDDEFVVMLAGVRDLETIELVAQNIIDAFCEPLPVDGHMLNITFSIGISVYPHDGTQCDMLLRKADTSLYHAKEAGRNTYRFFTDRMNVEATEYLQLQGGLRQAIANREFVLHYQPQIDLENGRVIGAEALVRWRHPERGLIPPDRFIPLAERSGMIVPIGEWVLNEACRQACTWRGMPDMPPLVMAVNLSALQFRRGNLVETVTAALAVSGLPAERLELELTESILLQDMESAIGTLGRLRLLGIGLAIDDFGTGYSSLSYLKRLAIDKLKIDKSFVEDMAGNADAAAITRAVIQLGHTLQLTVIAEGVENETQRDLLRSDGCDQAQGYFYARPMPADEFAAFCRGAPRAA